MRLYQNVANKVQPSFADDPLEPLYLDDDGNLSSLDNVVPAPTRYEEFRSVQPLECAWTNVETGVRSLVPAPRLELGTGSSENIVRLQCITQVALDELERGTTRHAKAILATLMEVLSGC